MITRLRPNAIIVTATASIVAVLVAGTALVHSRFSDAPPAGVAHLASVLLRRSASDFVPLAAILAKQQRTALLIFSPDCNSCVAEAIVWQRLSVEYRAEMSVIGAARTEDTAKVAMVRSMAGVTFPIYLVDHEAVQALEADPLPRVFVVDADGTVEFTASEHGSTAALVAWLKSERAGAIGRSP